MNQPQSGAQAPQHDDAPERSAHRRGSDVESLGHSAEDQHNEERLQSDDAGEIEQAPEEPPVDETDELSMGGPDSLEDVEDDREHEDIER